MRMLHTSDWHVGRTFHGADLLDDQARALTHLARVVQEESVDVVVVAGDVYDRAVPDARSVQVCNDGFERIRAAGASLVVTSGNHDSAARLGAAASFAAAGGLHLRTRLAAVAEPVVLTDRHGPVAFYGLPFLEPDVARHALAAPAARSHADVLGVAMERVREDLRGRPGVRSVVVAHAFVVGGATAGSERTISVGGVETVPAAVFDGVDYVALGHLHSPQTLTERVRYSGSLLPYSFGESTHRKAAWLVELGPNGLGEVIRIDQPGVRGLSTITGTIEEVLHDPAHEAVTAHYVSAVLTDPVRPVDAMRRLQTRFPHAVHLEWRPPAAAARRPYAEKVRNRADREVVESFLVDVRGPAHPWESELVLSGVRAADPAESAS